MPNRQDYVSRFRQHIDQLITVVNDLQEDAIEARRLGHMAALTSGDLQGANADVTVEDLQTSMATVVEVLTAITEPQKDAIYRSKL